MSEDTITRAEYNELLKRTEELQKALKAEQEARTKAEKEAAERRVDKAEDKLEAAAREAGVSVASLKAAAEAERQAEFDRRMDAWAESRGVELPTGKESENGGGGDDDDTGGDDDDKGSEKDDDDAGDKPKSLRKPKKDAAKTTKEVEDTPDKPHWSERPIFKRKGGES